MTNPPLVKNSFAFFDFDDTLMYGDSILYWRRYFYRKKPLYRVFQLVEWFAILLHIIRIIDTQRLKKYFFVSSCYCSSSDLNQMAEDFVKEELVPRLYPATLHMMWAHHKLGHKIVLISASSLFYLRFLSIYLPPAIIMGTQWDFPNRGLFRLPVYRKGIGNLKEEQKVIQIRSRSDLPNEGHYCFAYSDSIADRFLLAFVEFPTVVDPDVMLKKIAQKNGWPIIHSLPRKSSLAINFEKLFGLIFAVGGAPGHNKIWEDVKKSWQSDKFDKNCYFWMSHQIQKKWPVAKFPEIHQALFPGFPVLAATEASGLLENQEGQSLGDFKNPFVLKKGGWSLT